MSARRLWQAAGLWLLLNGKAAMGAVDLGSMWNFADPAGSEQRFRAALAQASGDDALV